MKNYICVGLAIVTLLLIFPLSSEGYNSKIVIDANGNAYFSRVSLVVTKKEDDFGKIFKYNVQHKGLYGDYTIVDSSKCQVHYLSIDPTGNKIAFNGSCIIAGGDYKMDGIIYHQYYNYISVIDSRTKKVIIGFDHGYSFAFSPKGDAILYIEEIPGEPGSPAPPGYQGGIWLYDFADQKKIKISSPVGSCDFNWSPHDGRIYFTDSAQHVYRYDASKGQGSMVTYKGIYFSPDKKYNISDVCGDRDDVDAYPHIYRISDHKKMTEWTDLLLKKSGQWPPPQYNRPGLSFEFFCNKMNAAVFSAMNEQNLIFDLSKGSVIGEFRGRVLGTNPDGSQVLINPVKPDQPQQVDHSKVEILNLLDLIKK